jgi:hypothetical protein
MSSEEIKSLLADSIYCELNLLQLGKIECANIMLRYRQAIHWRLYIIDCLVGTYPAENKLLIEKLMEDCKELILMITLNKC